MVKPNRMLDGVDDGAAEDVALRTLELVNIATPNRGEDAIT
jgi:hypothetical protein